MKFIKIVCLLLAVTFLSTLLPACADVVTVNNVRLAVILESPKKAGEAKAKQELYLPAMAADIKSTDGENPTVLDAVIQILEESPSERSSPSLRTREAVTTTSGYLP